MNASTSVYYQVIDFKPSPKQKYIVEQIELIRKERRERNNNLYNNNNGSGTPGGVSGVALTRGNNIFPLNPKSLPMKKNSKYYTLKVRIEFDGSLSKPPNRLFKFFKDDLSIFVDEYDFRRPDYRLVFLKNFTIIRVKNDYPFPVLVTLSGLPETRESPSTHDVLLHAKTESDKTTDLLKASKKKNLNQCPIPDPEFEIINFPGKVLSYTTRKFISEIPKEFCRCHEIGGNSLSCTRDADLVSKQYNVFDLFGFYISVARLGDNGDFGKHFAFPTTPSIISLEFEFRYYFLHYFNTNLEKSRNRRN